MPCSLLLFNNLLFINVLQSINTNAVTLNERLACLLGF
ncbi:hypothetical protein PESP_b0472 [Pseudoalteromonas espejiana DSM 9414]|nr:hypothetical protein PESP_b0472 [Pseudoalteromonas espejiana DSM 9414]